MKHQDRKGDISGEYRGPDEPRPPQPGSGPAITGRGLVNTLNAVDAVTSVDADSLTVNTRTCTAGNQCSASR
jgi:hypothetical protein